MCTECKKREIYKFELCERCYGKMFEEYEKLTDSLHVVSIIQKTKFDEPTWWQLQYALEERSRFITHEHYLTTAQRFEVQTEFFTKGKITCVTPSLFTSRKEKEVIEPKSIRFLPVESTYVKTDAMIMIPSVLDPRLIWTKGEFDRWNMEAVKASMNFELTQEELYEKRIEIAQCYGMKFKAH